MIDVHGKSLIQKELSITATTIDKEFFKNNSGLYFAAIPVIKDLLCDLSGFYPDFENWLEEKVYKGIVTGERSIILHYINNDISGLAIVKDTECEKKLCCLRVLPKYQGSGVGIKLFQKSFNTLNCDKPLLSISQEKEADFLKVFRYFGFSLEKKYIDYYRKGSYENSFNGYL